MFERKHPVPMGARMNRAEQIRNRLVELEHEVPHQTARVEEEADRLEALRAERRHLRMELDRLEGRRRRGRHLHAVKDERNVFALLLMAAAALARFRPQRLALAASSTAVVGTTVAALTLGAPAMLRPSATRDAPRVVYVPVSEPTVASSAAPSGPAAVRPSAPPPAPAVTPPVASARTPAAVPPTTPQSGPSALVTLPSLPIPTVTLSVPPLPASTLTVTVPGTPSPAGTCAIVVNLQPVLGACVLTRRQ